MPADVERPKCCAECLRFYRDPDNPGKGWCEEFPAAGLLDENVVCRPNVGRRITHSAFARTAHKTKPEKNGRKE